MLVGDLGDGEFGTDAAAARKRMRERHAADLGGHLVGDQPIEPGFGARPRHLVLGEWGEIDDAHVLPQIQRLATHVRKIIGAAEAPLVSGRDARGREPIGAFPAVALPEHGAHAGELVVDRTGLGRARIGPLLVRKVDDEDVAVSFLVLLNDVALAGVGAVAARVDRHHVDAGLAVDDPLSQLPAGAAGGGDAEAVALIEPEVAHTPGGADQRATVGCIGNRAVDDVLDAAGGKRRHAPLGGLDVRQKPLEVALEQTLAEPVGHTVGEPGGRAGFVGPQDPAHPLLAQVVGLIGFAQHRELAAAGLSIGFELRGFVVNDVLMLDRDGGHVQSEQAPGLAQRHRQVRRRNVAVIGMVERAHDVLGVAAVAELDQRPELLHLLGGDDLERHTDGVGRAAVLLILVHAVAACREAQIPGDVEAHVLPGFGGQSLVQVDRIFVQLPDRIAHVEERQQPRSVPGRSGGELGTLDQHDIRPFLREVIERADAYRAPSDDDDAGMSFHLSIPRGNSLRSVTSARRNNKLIATIPDVNAPWPPGHVGVRGSRARGCVRPMHLECDIFMSEMDISGRADGIMKAPKSSRNRVSQGRLVWNRPQCSASASMRS